MTEDDQLAALGADLRELSAEVGLASGKLDAHHAAYEADKKAQEVRTAAAQRKAKRATFLGIVGVVASLLSIYLVLDSRWTTSKNRAATCEAQAAQALSLRTALAGSVEFTLGRLLTDLTPEQQAELDAFFADHAEFIAGNVPIRDCTPRGIADYLSPGGPEGYLP